MKAKEWTKLYSQLAVCAECGSPLLLSPTTGRYFCDAEREERTLENFGVTTLGHWLAEQDRH